MIPDFRDFWNLNKILDRIIYVYFIYGNFRILENEMDKIIYVYFIYGNLRIWKRKWTKTSMFTLSMGILEFG